MSLTIHPQDGSLSGIDPTTLAIFEVVNGVMTPLKSSVKNPDGSATAQILHSDMYFLAAAFPTQLGGSYAFPVPFKPSSGHTLITFTNLATQSTIKVYTIMGELVWQQQSDIQGDAVTWNVKNNNGDNVASGVYIYQIKNGYSEKRGKLIIVR